MLHFNRFSSYFSFFSELKWRVTQEEDLSVWHSYISQIPSLKMDDCVFVGFVNVVRRVLLSLVTRFSTLMTGILGF